MNLLLSVVSIWEIQVKRTLGKLTVSGDLGGIVADRVRNGISVLPVQLSHVPRLDILPEHHKDPFDRLLVAQALEENLVLVTTDAAISRYPVPILW